MTRYNTVSFDTKSYNNISNSNNDFDIYHFLYLLQTRSPESYLKQTFYKHQIPGIYILEILM